VFFNKTKFEDLYNVIPNFSITGVSQSSNLKPNTISFSLNINKELIESLTSLNSFIIFVPVDSDLPNGCHEGNLIIECINPRYDYINTSRYTFEIKSNEYSSELFYVHPSAHIGNAVKLSPFTYIGANCVIEEECFISPGVKILEKVKIGRGTNIGSNIGALNTIVAGAIEPTILENNVMTDDHVHIAHNCKIRSGVAITACAEISGSVEVGEESWVGPNASIMQKIHIGPRSIIGLGAVVRKSIPQESIAAGNPAKILNKK
jgi:UDP-3-O-[3-hydroxymyristoyl] glucosamine N-acyltransferase